MPQNNLVSVIVPVYNCEAYLNECLDSLLNQSYGNVEIILVNDGSSDSSPRICDTYSSLHSNVHVYHQCNQGAAAARKTGMKYASGSYFLFVDSDDWVETDYIKDLLEPALEHDTDITIGHLQYFTPEGSMVWTQHLPCGCYNRTQLENTVYPTMLSTGLFSSAGITANMCGKLFRREIAQQNMTALDTGLRLGEDGCFTYACLLDCNRICVISKAGYIYRQNENSVTQRFNPKLLVEGSQLRERYLQLSAEKNWAMGNQLDEYMVRICNSVITSLLKDPTITYHDKKKMLTEYMDSTFPHDLLKAANRSTLSLKKRFKLFLIQNRLFFILSAIIKLNTIMTK